MVGLPFPNINTPEWKAKMQHVEAVAYNSYPVEQIANSTTNPPSVAPDESVRRAFAKAAAKSFYENACMRAVNQSIGRAIRHRNDYAVIVLVDRRYSTSRIQEKLPGWIKSGIVPVQGGDVKRQGIAEGRVVDVVKSCASFFRGRT